MTELRPGRSIGGQDLRGCSEASGDGPSDECVQVNMARRQPGLKPSFDLIKHKISESAFSCSTSNANGRQNFLEGRDVVDRGIIDVLHSP